MREPVMLVLICNVGSTSLKYKCYRMPEVELLAEAKMDRIGEREHSYFFYHNLLSDQKEIYECIDLPNYRAGILKFHEVLTGDKGVLKDISEIDAVGFKTVIGKGFTGIHLVDDALMKGLEDYLNVAPVHNTAYLEAIREYRTVLPDTTMVGVFEPHFHRTIPEYARIYGIPYEWTQEYGVQKYGFHGASHRYIAEASQRYGSPSRVISCHLGGSSSICAIKDGVSLDNSFGFSLQSGTLHANRTGDIDPYVLVYLLKGGMSMDELLDGLVKNGGLRGISGVSNDLRDIEQAAKQGVKRAQLAIDTYCYGIVKYIGSYAAVLGGVDLLVFTAGIGENSAVVREKVVNGFSSLSYLGLHLDLEKNRTLRGEGLISQEDSPAKIAVIPTNEEFMLARQLAEFLQK